MKITFGRKFLGCTIATVLLAGIFVATLIVISASITPTVVITFGIFTVTLWFAYICGNVWSSWVKSKYFQAGLQDK